MVSCKKCANYKHKMCIWDIDIEKRKENIKDYDFDCFTSEADKMMCDMMCGCIEED